MDTLPDLLCEDLDVVFVGINPSLFSAAQGHYFARKTNRFWPCLSRSMLGQPILSATGLPCLEPQHDRLLLNHRIGFTDAAKRPTARAGDLVPGELAAGVEALLRKLRRWRPRVACFQGVTTYRQVHRVLAPNLPPPSLGLQPPSLGRTRLFVVPSPSPANAHFTPAQQTEWYDRLAIFLAARPDQRLSASSSPAAPTGNCRHRPSA